MFGHLYSTFAQFDCRLNQVFPFYRTKSLMEFPIALYLAGCVYRKWAVVIVFSGLECVVFQINRSHVFSIHWICLAPHEESHNEAATDSITLHRGDSIAKQRGQGRIDDVSTVIQDFSMRLEVVEKCSIALTFHLNGRNCQLTCQFHCRPSCLSKRLHFWINAVSNTISDDCNPIRGLAHIAAC